MRRVLAILAASAFVLALSLPLATKAVPARPAKTPTAAARNTAQDKDDAKEQHPEIQRAMRQLEAAKAGLQRYGAHDLGGHRVKAIDHIDQAIAELREAIAFDKH